MSGGERSVLIGCGFDQELAVGEGEPCPAAAKDAGSCLCELLLESGEAAEGGVDAFGELGLGFRAAADGERLPPEAVVGVAAALVAHGGADGFGHGAEIGEQRVNGLAGQLRMCRDGGVEVVDVGGVVLVVVQVHGGRVEVGLESIVGVGQWRQGEGTGGGCGGCGRGGLGERRARSGESGCGAERLEKSSSMHHGRVSVGNTGYGGRSKLQDFDDTEMGATRETAFSGSVTAPSKVEAVA